MFENTICAISTALQEGAISIVRISGEEAISIVSQIFTKDLRSVPSHTIHYGNIIDENWFLSLAKEKKKGLVPITLVLENWS